MTISIVIFNNIRPYLPALRRNNGQGSGAGEEITSSAEALLLLLPLPLPMPLSFAADLYCCCCCCRFCRCLLYDFLLFSGAQPWLGWDEREKRGSEVSGRLPGPYVTAVEAVPGLDVNVAAMYGEMNRSRGRVFLDCFGNLKTKNVTDVTETILRTGTSFFQFRVSSFERSFYRLFLISTYSTQTA